MRLCGLPQLGMLAAFAAWPQGNAHLALHNMAEYRAWEKQDGSLVGVVVWMLSDAR